MRGAAKMPRMFLGEADQRSDERLYEQFLKMFRMMDIAGAIVYRGIPGYGAKGHTHRAHFVDLPHNFPLMIAVIDKDERIESAIRVVTPMISDGLIVRSDVDVIRLAHAVPLEQPVAN